MDTGGGRTAVRPYSYLLYECMKSGIRRFYSGVTLPRGIVTAQIGLERDLNWV